MYLASSNSTNISTQKISLSVCPADFVKSPILCLSTTDSNSTSSRPHITATETIAATTTTSSKSHPALPEECLQVVFDCLSRDISALHSLSLVSRTFFRIAVPLLYACPFDLIERSNDWSPQERTKRHASLLYLLMNCRLKYFDSRQLQQQQQEHQQDNHPDRPKSKNVLPSWYNLPPICPRFQECNEALKNPIIDYLSSYHHHYLFMNLSSTFPILFPNIQRFSPPPPPPNTTLGAKKSRQYGSITFTRNEIERMFLSHCPDLVKTISIPIQKLPDFESMGPMLSTLSCLELYGITWNYNLEHAVHFVRNHSKLFGTIQTIKFAGPNDTKILKKPRLHDILKAIKNPKTIDLSRFKEAARDLNTFEIQNIQGLEQLMFDLEYVPIPQSSQPSTSDPSHSIIGQSPETVATAVPPSFIQDLNLLDQENHSLDMIQKCTSLTTLHIGVKSPTGFAWARDWYQNSPAFLPKLKTLHVSSNRTLDAKQIFEDCIYAFQDTIQNFKCVSLKLSRLVVPVMDTKFGLTRPLNQLTKLELKGELAVWFDLGSLKHCPMLRELHLNLLPYSPPDLDHLSEIAIATDLKVLSILGRWMLSDSIMDSFGENLKSLERLDLAGCECSFKSYREGHRTTLTEQGLERNLKKLRSLAWLEVDLPKHLEEMLKSYNAVHPKPHIHFLSDDTSTGEFS